MSNNKRDLIFNAVIDIIKESGFNSSITISDIAKRADIGKGTIYEYFSTKDELLTETIIHILDSYKDYIIQANENDDFITDIHNLINRIIELNKRIYNTFAYKDLSNLFNKEFQIRINKKSLELHVLYYQYFESIVKKGINEKLLSPNYTVFEITTVIQTLTVSCSDFVRQLNENGLVDINEHKNNLTNMIIKMLS